jgi:sulfate adenylyltransferase subunit 2
MDYLDILENKSVYIIREAYYRFKHIGMLWSVGKDSTTLLWLIRKAFFGNIPFPVIHIDTSYKFPEMYAFRDHLAKKWNIKLLVAKNEMQLQQGMGPQKGLKFECCNELKTNALKQFIAEKGIEALFVGIRRDEHGIRGKERYFSSRNEQFQWDYQSQTAEIWDQYHSVLRDHEHVRLHPLLHFTETDIWRYIKREGIPVVDLYFSREGKRFRSIGCVPCCAPVDSDASTIDEIIHEVSTSTQSERAGRAQDKENMYTMQKLRLLGYL